jgi:hypothetical protein
LGLIYAIAHLFDLACFSSQGLSRWVSKLQGFYDWHIFEKPMPYIPMAEARGFTAIYDKLIAWIFATNAFASKSTKRAIC